MSRPRLQRCDRSGCEGSARHGWPRGRRFYCSLTCMITGGRR